MTPLQLTKLRQLQIRLGAIAIRCMQDDREETKLRIREAIDFVDGLLIAATPHLHQHTAPTLTKDAL